MDDLNLLVHDDEAEETEEEEEEDEEEAPAEDEEIEEYLDREPYYELYRSLMKEYPMLRMKNNFLQRKMAEYFKRRKVDDLIIYHINYL